jgi:Xaa-Pro dipeptidase
MGTTDKKVHEARLEKLRQSLLEKELQGAIIVPGPNSRFLTGVNSLLLERPFVFLVPVSGTPQLVAPKLEAGPYTTCPLEMNIHDWTDSEGSEGSIKKATAEIGLKGKWGVEGRVPFLFISKLLKHSSPVLHDAEMVFQGLREVKDEQEIECLKKAAKILTDSFEEFPSLIKEGVTELELARKASEVIYGRGATRVEDVLVQTGARCADPHGLPSDKKVRRGEGMIFDISCNFEGYYSDITRTFCLGSSDELKKVYSDVLEAEELGIREAAEGTRVGDVDGAVRNRLRKAGLARYFIHRTGHGLGLEVHEAPYIVEGGYERLRNGMCFTVEPGAYLRGKLGVRIEDDILLENGSASEITHPPKEYEWWT